MEKSSVIYVLDSNKNSREILKSYIDDFNLNVEIKIFSDYRIGVNDIKAEENIPIVFVDISETKPEMLESIESIRLLTPKIIITSNDYSTSTIIQAMRLGAKEFLPKPIIKEDLLRIITMLLYQEFTDQDIASKVITIYSNKGGIGKTTIATNLAVELAKTTRDKVALVDLNLQLGDVSTFLNINPSFDVAYVLKNLTDKKEDSLINAFERIQNIPLYVLSDPSYIEQSEAISPEQIEKLFQVLKRMFSYVVIDMSSNIEPTSLKILDKSDFVLFTTIVNIPAIRNAQRCLNLFRSRRYPMGKVKILVNRFIENDDIKIEDIETALGEKIYWKIPNNYFSIMESINKGIPISDISSDSNIANSFKDLALKLSDDIVEETITKYRGI